MMYQHGMEEPPLTKEGEEQERDPIIN